VEDEPLIAASIEWELKDCGFEVLGPAASAAHAEDLASVVRPDLALVDINLLSRGDGVRLARNLRKRGVESVFVTGQLLEARENCDAALGVVAKPFPVEDLGAVVRCAVTIVAGGRPKSAPPCLELFARPATDQSLRPSQTAAA
jgi:DNA-binding response OmpR family regulator